MASPSRHRTPLEEVDLPESVRLTAYTAVWHSALAGHAGFTALALAYKHHSMGPSPLQQLVLAGQCTATWAVWSNHYADQAV